MERAKYLGVLENDREPLRGSHAPTGLRRGGDARRAYPEHHIPGTRIPLGDRVDEALENGNVEVVCDAASAELIETAALIP